jgi:uncharacterized caspase-like protein
MKFQKLKRTMTKLGAITRDPERRAFLMAANGPEEFGRLKYAESDATRLGQALTSRRCDFEVEHAPSDADTYDVRRLLDRAAARCNPQDTFVCYFAGHGLLHQGRLYLVWHRTTSDVLTTAIPADDVLHAMRLCVAKDRLLILDCCHAGGAVGLRAGNSIPVSELPVVGANHVVLMGSDRLERVREFESLGGAFLTVKLCEALTDRFYDADSDGDLRLSMDDLMTWFEQSLSRTIARTQQ